MEPICLPDFPDDTDIRINHGLPLVLKGKYSYAINPRYFAAKLIKQHGLIYFRKGGFFEWTDDGWIPALEQNIKYWISDMVQDEVRGYGNTNNRPEPSMPAYDLVNTRNIKEILETMKYMCNHGDALPPLDPDVVPVKTGLLRWNAEKQDFDFRAYTPDDMIFHTLDVAYVPEAKSDLFQETLTRIMPDPDDRRVSQEYLGSILFPENRTKKFMTFTGTSNSGKSALLGAVVDIMTPKRIFDLDLKTLAGDYGLSALTNQTLITIFEAGKDAFCNPFVIEFIKKATGRDSFKTNRKNSNEQVEHVGLYSILFTSNYNQRFEFEGDGGEFANRLLPILFTKPIENPDLTLGDRLSSDHRSAIFNWLLDGARRVRRNNWDISLSPAQTLRRDRLIQATRGIDLFVNNFIVAVPSQHITTAAAYEAYIHLHYAAGFEYLDETVFQRRFAKAMAARFGKNTCKNLPGPNGKYNVRGYQDVAFANNPSPSTNNQK